MFTLSVVIEAFKKLVMFFRTPFATHCLVKAPGLYITLCSSLARLKMGFTLRMIRNRPYI